VFCSPPRHSCRARTSGRLTTHAISEQELVHGREAKHAQKVPRGAGAPARVEAGQDRGWHAALEELFEADGEREGDASCASACRNFVTCQLSLGYEDRN
jgi:hypothetical protein